MKLTKDVIDYCKDVLNRYGWTRWEGKQMALVEARVSRGRYLCAHCSQLFGPKDVQVDHVHPRIDPVSGWISLDEYAARTFVSGRKLQVLCKPCHSKKTVAENATRRRAK